MTSTWKKVVIVKSDYSFRVDIMKMYKHKMYKLHPMLRGPPVTNSRTNNIVVHGLPVGQHWSNVDEKKVSERKRVENSSRSCIQSTTLYSVEFRRDMALYGVTVCEKTRRPQRVLDAAHSRPLAGRILYVVKARVPVVKRSP